MPVKRLPLKRVEVHRTDLIMKIMYYFPKWTVVGYKGPNGLVSITLGRFSSLSAVRRALNEMPDVDQALISMVEGDTITPIHEDDWVMLILSESPE